MADGKIIYDIRADDSKLDGDIDRANGKAEKGASKLGGIAKGAMVAVGAAFVAGGAASIKFGAEFETSMAMASTLIDTTKTDMTSLNNKMLELSSATGVAASELGGALYQALSAGVPATEDMAEAMEFLEKNTKLAKAAGADITTVIDTTTSVINAYGLELQDTERIHKILMQTQNLGKTTVAELGQALSQVTPIAASSGVSFEQVGAALATITSTGETTSAATTKLKTLFAELSQSGTKGSKALAEATKNTQHAGKSFSQLVKEGVPLNEILGYIEKSAAENNLSMTDMFGSIEAGSAALMLTGTNSEKFSQVLEDMATDVDVVGEAFEKNSKTSAQQFNKIINELKNTFIQLFIALKPAIDKLLPAFATLIKDLAPLISDLVVGLMPLVTDILGKLLPPLTEIIGKILPIIISLLGMLIPPLLQIIEALLPPLMMLINALLPILDLVIGLLEPILDIFVALLEPILALITAALEPLLAIITPLIELGLKLLSTELKVLLDVFKSVTSGIFEYVSGQFGRVKDIFGDLIKFIKCVFTGNWKGAWDNIKNIFANIWDTIKNCVKAPINFIIDAMNKLISGLNKLQIKMPDWLGGETFGINIPLIPRLKKGKAFVPQDYFPAFLDYGERVMTQEQNSKFNSMGGLSGMERALSGTVTSTSNQAITVHNVLRGDIEMDGFKVGTVVMRNIDDVLKYR